MPEIAAKYHDGLCNACNKIQPLFLESDVCDRCMGIKRSKFMINDMPVSVLINDLLIERPEVMKIANAIRRDNKHHFIIRLEDDGLVYSKPIPAKQQSSCFGFYQDEPHPPRKGVPVADPDLIPKLHAMIDEHLIDCEYCSKVLNES